MRGESWLAIKHLTHRPKFSRMGIHVLLLCLHVGFKPTTLCNLGEHSTNWAAPEKLSWYIGVRIYNTTQGKTSNHCAETFDTTNSWTLYHHINDIPICLWGEMKAKHPQWCGISCNEKVYSETSRTGWEKPGTISERWFLSITYNYSGRTPQLAPLH